MLHINHIKAILAHHIINNTRMGNGLMEQCNGHDNKIQGFNTDMIPIIKEANIAIPARTKVVEETYQLLQVQKSIDYSLELQKNSFQPIQMDIFRESGVYLGWIRNDKPHGPGQLYFHNNNYLQAIFKEGEIDCDDAIFIENNGNYYRGGFRASKQRGLGVLKTGKDKLIGHFTDGLAQGKGEKLFADGRIYRGKFKNGKMEGKGTLQITNKQLYQGFFRDDKRNGIGRLATDHFQYFGPFKEDKMEGKGTAIFKDGAKFEGWFSDNKIEGYGEWHRKNGMIEKGTYTLALPL